MDRRSIPGLAIGGDFDLHALVPFDSMDEELLARIRRRARVREHACGDVLFRAREPNDEVLYVLSGSVELSCDGRRLGVVQAGSDAARRPLSKSTTHMHSAEVLSRNARLLSIDADRLDMLVTLEQTASYRVANLHAALGVDADPEDWMVQVLRSRAFAKIPPVNIQAMFMRLQRVDRKAGEVVIRQGDEGDYFYMVARGRCVVTRDMPTDAPPLRLAELGVGATFGEEALIGNGRRSANVLMETDGTLMRLPRADFETLCSRPLIRELTLAEANQAVQRGARWLDVRLPGEVVVRGIPGAMRVPLHLLRSRIGSLPASTPLIACCESGRRSSVAAFVLAQQGFDVATLKGGLAATGAEFAGQQAGQTPAPPHEDGRQSAAKRYFFSRATHGSGEAGPTTAIA